jgi:hypothetical protein
VLSHVSFATFNNIALQEGKEEFINLVDILDIFINLFFTFTAFKWRESVL